ncbi:MAG TPA: DUF5681 domain-containing protein [Clostridia bacterium]
MQTIGETQASSTPIQEQQKNSEIKKPTGFQNPEQRANINRAGRPPRDWTWKGLLEEVAEEMVDIKKEGKVTGRKAMKELLARKLLQTAISGNIQAANSVMDRMDGKPMQQIDHTTQGDKIPGPIIYQPSEDK